MSVHIYICIYGFGTAVGGRVSSGSHHIYLYLPSLPALLAGPPRSHCSQAKAVGALNMPPLPFKCAMCKKIARPAVSLTVDSTKDWEAAVLHNQGPADPAKIKPWECPVSGRDDGRIDLVLCFPCAEERRELEAIEESKNDDDAREDAELEQALRLSMTDEQKSLLDGQAREDAELAEALRLSMSDARPAEPEKALRSSNGPPEKRSDLDARLAEALRLSMLSTPPEERSDSEEPEALRQSGSSSCGGA